MRLVILKPARILAALWLWALALIPASAADLAHLRNGFTIRHERRIVSGDNTRLFLGSDRASFIDVPTADIESFEKDLTLPAPNVPQTSAASANIDLNQIVTSASSTYSLDPDLVNSVIHAESGFNPHAVSKKGAQGLMQLMPSTAGQLGVSNPFNAEENVGGGTRYLRQLLEHYHFDLVKALAAYNAGPRRVEQYRGVPPYKETRAYVARIVRDYNRKKIAQQNKPAAAPATAHKPASTKAAQVAMKSAPVRSGSQ